MKPNQYRKPGQIAIMISFVLSAMIIIAVAAVLAPTAILFNSELFQAGEDLLDDANESISNIHDVTIRNNVLSVVAQAKQNTQTNIEINAAMFQYAWVIVLVLGGLIMFLFTRRLVEYGYSGFV